MLKIKLAPSGKKGGIKYRIVVVEENTKLSGKVTAVIGHCLTRGNQLVIEQDQVKYWLGHGATPTATVAKILKLN